MQYKNLKELFDTYFKHVKFDKALAVDFRDYLSEFITRNDQHVRFFGGTLVGVYKCVFTPADKNRLWGNILEIDRLDFASSYQALPSIDRNHKVERDETNMLFLYLLYRFKKDGKLNEAAYIQVATIILMISQIKFITSMINWDYKYTVDKDLAITVNNQLSRKFILRRYDSWKEVLTYRAHSWITDTDRKGWGRIAPVLRTFGDDGECKAIVVGIHGKCNATRIAYNKVFHDVYENEQTIQSRSMMGEVEGDAAFLDKVSVINGYVDYGLQTCRNKDQLIKDDLVSIVLANSAGVTYKSLFMALKYIAQNVDNRKTPQVRLFVERSLVFCLNYMRREKIDPSHLLTVFKSVKGGISSARSADKLLLDCREAGDFVVEQAINANKLSHTFTAIRTSLTMYVLLRALTRKHYTE